jgi:hypothetical protein
VADPCSSAGFVQVEAELARLLAAAAQAAEAQEADL